MTDEKKVRYTQPQGSAELQFIAPPQETDEYTSTPIPNAKSSIPVSPFNAGRPESENSSIGQPRPGRGVSKHGWSIDFDVAEIGRNPRNEDVASHLAELAANDYKPYSGEDILEAPQNTSETPIPNPFGNN